MLRKIDRLMGRIGTGAGDDGNAAARLVDAPFDDVLVLVVRQRRALAGGADRNQAIGSLGDLPIDQIAEGFFVDDPFLNGVTSAVNEPRNVVLAAMIRSLARSPADAGMNRPSSIIIGSGRA